MIYKEFTRIQNSIYLDNLSYFKNESNYDFNQNSITIMFLSNIYNGKISVRDLQSADAHRKKLNAIYFLVSCLISHAILLFSVKL